MAYIRKTDQLLKLGEIFGSTENMTILTARRDKLQDVRNALKNDKDAQKSKYWSPSIQHSTDVSAELPKAIREAIQRLSLDTKLLDATLSEILTTNPDDLPERDYIDYGCYKVQDWEEGVDQYRNSTTEDLCTALGISCVNGHPRIPGLQEDIDPTGKLNSWENLEEFLAAKAAGKLIPLEVKWHQMVGIHKMITNAFEGKPVLLMDEVGVGKTLQVIATILMLANFRDYYDQNHNFPGSFSKYTSILISRHCSCST